MAFEAGDRVVLSPYGLGVVSGTCQRPLAGQTHAYYEVQFASTVSRAYVPVANPDGSGLRRALGAPDLPGLLTQLRDSQLQLPVQWSARQRVVTELLAGGDPFELAALTCVLRRWNVQRGLPDLDRQALRRAIRLLEQEVEGLHCQRAREVQALLHLAWSEGPAA